MTESDTSIWSLEGTLYIKQSETSPYWTPRRTNILWNIL